MAPLAAAAATVAVSNAAAAATVAASAAAVAAASAAAIVARAAAVAAASAAAIVARVPVVRAPSAASAAAGCGVPAKVPKARVALLPRLAVTSVAAWTKTTSNRRQQTSNEGPGSNAGALFSSRAVGALLDASRFDQWIDLPHFRYHAPAQG